MTVMTIADRVKLSLARDSGMPIEKIAPECRLAEDLGLDSMDRVEATMDLEDEFSIHIPDDDAEKLRTVGDVIAYVERVSAAQAGQTSLI